MGVVGELEGGRLIEHGLICLALVRGWLEVGWVGLVFDGL